MAANVQGSLIYALLRGIQARTVLVSETGPKVSAMRPQHVMGCGCAGLCCFLSPDSVTMVIHGFLSKKRKAA